MKKKIIIGLVAIALIALIAIPRVLDKSNDATQTLAEKAITVEAAPVQKGRLASATELISTVEASSSVNILPAAPAKVETIHVKVGDQVKKGDLLFTLDEKDVRLQVNQAQTGVTTAQAAVSQAQLGLKNSEQAVIQATLAYDMAKANYDINQASYQDALKDLEKYEALYKEGYLSQSEFEKIQLKASPSTATLLEKQLEQAQQALTQAQLGLETAQIGITQAQAGSSQAQQSYERALDTLDDMTFEAPMDGTITAIYLVENQMASNAQPAIVIDAMDTILIKANVTDTLVNKLKINQPVRIKISSLEDYEIEGKIDTIGLAADARTMLYPVTVEVPNQDHLIKPGMFATIEIDTDIRENALYIPNEAILMKDHTYFVYVVTEDGKASHREIEIGLNSGVYTEVTKGLSEGEIVVTKGGGLINEDTLIQVIRGDE